MAAGMKEGLRKKVRILRGCLGRSSNYVGEKIQPKEEASRPRQPVVTEKLCMLFSKPEKIENKTI